jgi:hypothetical protein
MDDDQFDSTDASSEAMLGALLVSLGVVLEAKRDIRTLDDRREWRANVYHFLRKFAEVVQVVGTLERAAQTTEEHIEVHGIKHGLAVLLGVMRADMPDELDEFATLWAKELDLPEQPNEGE